MRRIFVVMAIAIICVSGRYTAFCAAGDWTVYLSHAGPVRIGMTLPEVRRIFHDNDARLAGPDEADECAYFESAKTPKGLGIMFSRGRVVRIDVYKPGIRTATGIGVGDTEDEVKRKYPEHLKVEPHPYNPETGHYLIYNANGDLGMIFETDENKVTSFRTGTISAIALIEGCS